MVYFFMGQETKLLKIGVSHSRTFDNRLKQCQAHSPDILKCVAVRMDWSYHEERVIHKKFRHLRSHGEWYKLDEEFSDFLVNIDSQNLIVDKEIKTYPEMYPDEEAIINPDPNKVEVYRITYKKRCPECQITFTTKYKYKIYCSQKCNFKSWNKRNSKI